MRLFRSRKEAAQAPPASECNAAGVPAEVIEQTRVVIDSFRPFIQADGGDIDFLGVDDRYIAKVRLRGACVGCPSSFMTLQMGIERHLRERVPSIRGVENVA